MRSITFVPTTRLELRLSYVDMRDGGYAAAGLLRVTLPMPYVMIPGLSIRDWYSLVRVDVPVVHLDTPQVVETGVADIHVIEGTVIPFEGRGAIGFGYSLRFPSATNPALGSGKLVLGPVAGAVVWVRKRLLSVGMLAQNLWSVTGEARRDDIHVLEVQPLITLNLPRANYLLFDPIWRFDWTRDGEPTIPVNLNIGHGFTRCLVLEAGPQWVVSGDGKNDILIRMVVSYVGW